jgi:transcriptional regulator with XRE-family HTH domain
LPVTNPEQHLPDGVEVVSWLGSDLRRILGVRMLSAGQNLRALREHLGLTMRDVETSSAAIAAKHESDEFAIPPSRLSDIETKGVVPSIYRLYSLSVIYRKDAREILAWYGVDLNKIAEDLQFGNPPKSHKSEALENVSSVRIPVRMDPSFDPRYTANMGRVVEQWGVVPLTYLAQFADRRYTYGYIGSDDFTMYPILPPGSFVQIDESKTRVAEGAWRSEYERPIYFVETRDGYTCCWCTLQHEGLVLQSHPLSPVPVRVLKHPQEAEVIGQVVGVAMRLGEWFTVETLPEPREREALN